MIASIMFPLVAQTLAGTSRCHYWICPDKVFCQSLKDSCYGPHNSVVVRLVRDLREGQTRWLSQMSLRGEYVPAAAELATGCQSRGRCGKLKSGLWCWCWWWT